MNLIHTHTHTHTHIDTQTHSRRKIERHTNAHTYTLAAHVHTCTRAYIVSHARPSYEKIEKGSGQTGMSLVFPRDYTRAPIRFKYRVT